MLSPNYHIEVSSALESIISLSMSIQCKDRCDRQLVLQVVYINQFRISLVDLAGELTIIRSFVCEFFKASGQLLLC